MMGQRNKEVKFGPLRSLRQAMSLTELMVILFILSLGTAMVVPLTGNSRMNQLKQASYRVISDIQYVQTQAIMTRTAQSLAFDVLHGEYYFSRIDNPTEYKTDPFTKKDYRIFFHDAAMNTLMRTKPHTEEFPDIELVSADFGGESTLYFDSLGLPSDSAGDSLSTAKILIRGDNLTRTLTIDTSTGRVTIN